MLNNQSTYPVSSSKEQSSVETWRVLIVDDQWDNLTLAGTVFGLRGAVVELVDNARTALSILNDFQPTVILVDLAMPDMDGWELVKAIRKLEVSEHTPVLALTVRVNMLDPKTVLASGFDGFIAKPYSITGIVSQIQEILANLASQQA